MCPDYRSLSQITPWQILQNSPSNIAERESYCDGRIAALGRAGLYGCGIGLGRWKTELGQGSERQCLHLL